MPRPDCKGKGTSHAEANRSVTMKKEDSLLAEVAILYYYDGLTQEEIAKRLNISRTSVSRMLSEARRRRIVEIHINYPWEIDQDLQMQLQKKFNLRLVRVLKVNRWDYKRILRGLGAITARYLEGILGENFILAIGWGTAIYHVVEAIKPMKLSGVQVVQMIGAVGAGDPFVDGPELARILAQKFEGTCYYLHAPLVVKDEKVRDALMNEPRIKEILKLAARANVALVGIGSTDPSLSSLLRAGYLTPEELMALREKEAVGDVCARHFDINGNILDIELNRRIVGIPIEDLKKIECVIGVAGGKAKAPAILGALKGGFINVLFTDSEAAQEILRLEAENSKGGR